MRCCSTFNKFGFISGIANKKNITEILFFKGRCVYNEEIKSCTRVNMLSIMQTRECCINMMDILIQCVNVREGPVSIYKTDMSFIAMPVSFNHKCLHLTFDQYLSNESYSHKYEKLPNTV